jgi:hypothetical protein
MLLFISGAVLTFVLSYRNFKKRKNKVFLALLIALLVIAAMAMAWQ